MEWNIDWYIITLYAMTDITMKLVFCDYDYAKLGTWFYDLYGTWFYDRTTSKYV